MGLFYLKGDLIPQDIDKAVTHITFAAENGHANAKITLANLHCQGAGVDLDLFKASELLEQSKQCSKIPHELASMIQKRQAETEFVLGELFQNGVNTPKSTREAIHHFRRAASAGHIESYHKVAEAYAKGKGVHVDYREAERNYALAEEQGLPAPLTTKIDLYLKNNCQII